MERGGGGGVGWSGVGVEGLSASWSYNSCGSNCLGLPTLYSVIKGILQSVRGSQY